MWHSQLHKLSVISFQQSEVTKNFDAQNAVYLSFPLFERVLRPFLCHSKARTRNLGQNTTCEHRQYYTINICMGAATVTYQPHILNSKWMELLVSLHIQFVLVMVMDLIPHLQITNNKQVCIKTRRLKKEGPGRVILVRIWCVNWFVKIIR